MTAISHALIGVSIAARIGNPYIAGSLAFITHFVCDAIPHWDWGTNWRLRPKAVTGTLAIIETVFSLTVIPFLFTSKIPLFLLMITIFFSLVPDWLEAPYYILMPRHPKIFYYLYKAQSLVHEKMQAPWGIITQIAVVLAFLWVGFGVK